MLLAPGAVVAVPAVGATTCGAGAVAVPGEADALGAVRVALFDGVPVDDPEVGDGEVAVLALSAGAAAPTACPMLVPAPAPPETG